MEFEWTDSTRVKIGHRGRDNTVTETVFINGRGVLLEKGTLSTEALKQTFPDKYQNIVNSLKNRGLISQQKKKGGD